MQNSNETGKLIGVLLFGAVIGGAVGILLAPEKGSELRKRMTAKSDELASAIKEKLNEFFEKCKEEVENAQPESVDVKKSSNEN